MPSSVRSVFAAAGLDVGGSVSWGARIPANATGPATGVYAVALTGDVDDDSPGQSQCPLSGDALRELLDRRPELEVDGQRPDADVLGERLAGFWLPDEVVLYVGLAGSRRRTPKEGELVRRVSEYYETPLGARRPHAGGWFLKTLAPLDELLVHYVYCENVESAEQAMLRAFADAVSPSSRAGLLDPEHVMPFANLEHPPGVRKRHGITGAREPRRRQPARKEREPPPAPPVSGEERSACPAGPAPADASDVTQRVTPGDVRSGILRIPKTAKHLLPPVKRSVRVELRGLELGECKWDPRAGPDRERSGVLRIGRAAYGRLEEGKRLRVERTQDGIRLL